MKKVTISVSSDLSTDQRVHKVATTLQAMGFDVLLIGRLLPGSMPILRKYKYKRMRMLFHSEIWFYMEYNIRLLFSLIFSKSDIYLSNDLDTLLPNFIVTRLRGKTLVYDSHEMFCEGPELQGRKLVQSIWRMIEKSIVPRLDYVYTVSQSIADNYNKRYKVNFEVIRNIPKLVKKRREVRQLNFLNKKIILYQGVMNPGRGLEEIISAMQFIDSAVLLIIGFGKVEDDLKDLVREKNLQDKVVFYGKVPFEDLFSYTVQADIGLVLEKPLGLSFTYSLPNKLFDYIHAGVPIIASPLVEVKRIMSEADIGVIIESYEPKYLANKINLMLDNKEKLVLWKKNMIKLSKKLNWEIESVKLNKLFAKLL